MHRRGAEDAEGLVRENHVSEAIIGAAIEVHRHLGPRLLLSFNVPVLTQGIRRIVLGLPEE
jgi:hypothetical protein